MRRQMSIYEMTDRELRAYKRELRRRKENRRRAASLMIAVFLIVICVVSYHSLKSSAKTGGEEIALKYYTGITVKNGDSLWSIADEYIDYSRYKNKEVYIEEMCSINNLGDDAGIHAGQRLVVPYYSCEYKQ